MGLPITQALRAASRFVFNQPKSIWTMAKHAAGLRMAVPLSAVRWFVENIPPQTNTPQDISIEAKPPAVQIGATVNIMNTDLRVSAIIYAQEIRMYEDTCQATLRISNVDLNILSDKTSPISGLLQSGVIDLSKPGNLINFIPKKPSILVEAHDDIVVIDLLQHPKLKNNSRFRKVLSAIAPVLTIEALRTDEDFLILDFTANVRGVGESIQAVKRQ